MSDSQLVALLDDDELFVNTLSRRLNHKGVNNLPFTNLETLKASSKSFSHLVLDMNLGNESVLHSLKEIRNKWTDATIILLTGYGSITTAVLAMKQGADQYLTKPLKMPELLSHLGVNVEKEPTQEGQEDFQLMTPAQLEWEQIQSVFHKNEGNVSATARELNMHRRTLQRKLQKKPRTT